MIQRYPAANLPQSGGINATVMVTMSLDTLLGGLGVGRPAHRPPALTLRGAAPGL